MAAATKVKAEQQIAHGSDADEVIEKYKFSDEELLRIYQQMLDVRHFEEQCNRAFRSNKVGGYLHLYIGQESVSLGVIHACKQGDQVVSSYRDHAHCLALGSDPNKLMAEIFGKSTGVSGGKGGSMHLFDKEHGFAGGYGIVGGNVPIALGLGWALKYQKTDNICVCYIGDGAMNTGAFHESMNMAALYKLPILFILENNGYAMGTSIARSHANTDLGSRADSYAIPHQKVDGQDYFAVRGTVEEVVRKMRTEPYPYVLDVITYRYTGHGAADGAATQATYRTHEEIERWKQRDPLIVLSNVLRSRGLLDDALDHEMDKKAIAVTKAAYDFAENSAVCEPSELFEDVYAD